MIVESGNRIIFDGNGIATDFPYSFIIINSTDIKVAISDDETGEVTVLTKDYFVDTAASKVVYPGYSPGQEPADEAIPEVLPVGKKLIVYRSVPLTQESDLGSKYPFDTIEKGLDKNCILIQQIADAQSRSLTLPVNTPFGFATELPTPEAGTSFRVNDRGTGYEVTLDPAKVLPLAENIKSEIETIKVETEAFRDEAETAATTAATEAAATAAELAVSDVQDILDDIVTEVNTAKTAAAESAATANTAATNAATNAAELAVSDVQDILDDIVAEVNTAKTAAAESAATANTKASEAFDSATSAASAASTAATASTNASNYASQAQTASSAAIAAGNMATTKASEANGAATTATNAADTATTAATTAATAADTATSIQTTVSGYVSSVESSVAEVNAAKASALGAAASADSSASTATTAADIASSSKAEAAQSAAEAAQSAADAVAAAGGDFIPSAQKGGVNGVATLDGSALLSSTQIPSIPANKITGTIELAASVPWSGVTGKPTFATVATSGSYNDLTDLPQISSVSPTDLLLETSQDLRASSSTLEIDFALGNVVSLYISTGSGVTITPTTSIYKTKTAQTGTIVITSYGRPVVWANTIQWAGGVAPELCSDGYDVVTLLTVDGYSWLGVCAGGVK